LDTTQTQISKPGEEIEIGGVRLMYIPPGEFMMGSPPEEKDRWDEEGPVHRVRIARGFYMSKYPIPWGLYKTVTGKDPSSYQGQNQPVENVTWYEARGVCKQLSKRSGVQFRLPTEAEWEYACRAGTTTWFYFGDKESEMEKHAWYGRRGYHRTHPVGLKPPNPWGLHDMYGNVWEWCVDRYDGGYYAYSPLQDPRGPDAGGDRVIRGGPCSHEQLRHGSARRQALGAKERSKFTGFRVCCASPPEVVSSASAS